MIYISSDNNVKQTQIGNFRSFLPFIPLKIPKIKILKNEKICWRYHHFAHVLQKSQSYDVWFLRYGVRQTKYFVILGHFLSFYLPPNDLEYQNFEKNPWRYYPFLYIPVYHKWRSYDIWFLKYKVQQTEIFDILGCFCPFTLLTAQKIKILKKWKKKKRWRYHYFTYV